MDIPIGFEIGSLVVLTLILVADLLLILKRPHIPSTKESTLWVVFYVTLALIFGGLMWIFAGPTHAGEFIGGWLTEYSLSIDNLFVFVLIMTQFKVPRRYQQEVLMVGIIIALILRGAFILLGAAVIEHFAPIFYIFGAFLLWTAYKQAFGGDHDDEEQKESRIVGFIRKRVAVSDDYDGAKIRTVINGKKMFTPMLIVFIAIGFTDLMFAIDSIPAIFGITKEPFIVFTANIFALMGLRQLYFLLGDLLDKLRYLHYGIAAILAFIGVKLILHALHENELPFINGGEGVPVWDIDIWTSLAFIVASMTIATVASLIAAARDRRNGVEVPTDPQFDAKADIVDAQNAQEGAELNTSSSAPLTDGTVKHSAEGEDFLKR